MADDTEILERAREIQERDGGTLTDAMIKAERQIEKETAGDENTFTITLELKPKVAKFYRKEFAGHPSLGVEERMGLWIAQLLNRERGQALARARDAKGHAVPDAPNLRETGQLALSRSAFLAQSPG